MPQVISRYQVKEMMGAGAQVIEVLPSEEFEDWHLPSAKNIPLKDFHEATVSQIDKSRPVIVYCADLQ